MSKQNKQKQKQQNPEVNLQEYEEMKKQNMFNHFTEVTTQERLQRMKYENEDFETEIRELKLTLTSSTKALEQVIEKLNKEISELKEQKEDLSIDLTTARKKQSQMEAQLASERSKLIEQHQYEKIELEQKIDFLQQKLESYQSFEKQKTQLERERDMLEQQLKKEKEEKQKELADRDREKVQATDKLKKDMLHRIQETKTSLLALKKEQLQTTTRLTVLQNHQLTTELEYQSKQTEKLLFKNSKLQEQVTTLKRDVEIHKQVEQELAKRSHFSQKLIKKLSQKIKELEDAEEDKRNSSGNPDCEDLLNFFNCFVVNNSKSKKEPFKEDKTKDEIIAFLEKNIENSEKKLAKLQNDFDILKNENQYLQKKLEQKANKYSNLAQLLADYLSQIQVNNENSEEASKIASLNLGSLAKKEVSDMTFQEKETIVSILLQQIKPLLNRKNLQIPESRNMTVQIIDDSNLVSLPPIGNTSNILQEEKKSNFKDVPLDISTKIIRSNMKDWTTNAINQPQNKSGMAKRKF